MIQETFEDMKQSLKAWQSKTEDPWICAPHAVLENKGRFKDNPNCMPLYNRVVSSKMDYQFLNDNQII